MAAITYHTAGGAPLGESRSTTLNGATLSQIEIQYVYDASGKAYGISAMVTDAAGNTAQHNYYYMHNLQGNVIGLWHPTLGPVCHYAYDAWGRLLSVTDASGNAITDPNHIAHINPIRYRGYYYDTESGLYYLQSRYYDAEVGRFISSDTTDVLTATPMALTDKHIYSYCDNNPIVRIDISGAFWESIFDVITFGASIVEVCFNPTDPWAWAGLVGDTVDLIPFVTGVGEATRAINTTVKVVDETDDIISAAKDIYKSADKASDIRKAIGSYEIMFKSGKNYIGKGGLLRAIASAKRYDEVAISIMWKSAPNAREAFIDEYLMQKRMLDKYVLEKYNPDIPTYNLIMSPGKRYFSE